MRSECREDGKRREQEKQWGGGVRGERERFPPLSLASFLLESVRFRDEERLRVQDFLNTK